MFSVALVDLGSHSVVCVIRLVFRVSLFGVVLLLFDYVLSAWVGFYVC